MFLKKLNFKAIYRWQLLVHAVIIVAYIGLHAKSSNLIIIIPAILACLLGLLTSYKNLPKLADRLVTSLLFVTYPFSIIATIGSAAKFLPVSYPLLMIYCLFAFIPVAYEFVIPRFKSGFSRTLLALWWSDLCVRSASVLIPYLPARHGFLYELLASTFWGALAFFLLAVFIMRAWGFSRPDWKSKGEWQVSTLIIIAVFCLYLLLLNSFNGSSLYSLLFPFNFKPLHLTWEFLFTGIEAGLLEETLVRYIILLCLISSFSATKRVKLGTIGAICLSSSIFGILHLSNLLAGQDMANTLVQSLAAAFLGIPFALIYLYTGKLSLAVLYHAVWDVINFSVSSSTQMSGKIDTEFLIFMSYLILLILLFTVYMLTGKRRQTIEANAQNLLDKQVERLKEA